MQNLQSRTGEMMMFRQLTQRVARLESRCAERRIQILDKGATDKLSRLSPDERRARIRLLTQRLMRARGITPARDETLVSQVVLAARTMKGFSNDLIPTLRRIFGGESNHMDRPSSALESD